MERLPLLAGSRGLPFDLGGASFVGFDERPRPRRRALRSSSRRRAGVRGRRPLERPWSRAGSCGRGDGTPGMVAAPARARDALMILRNSRRDSPPLACPPRRGRWPRARHELAHSGGELASSIQSRNSPVSARSSAERGASVDRDRPRAGGPPTGACRGDACHPKSSNGIGRVSWRSHE